MKAPAKKTCPDCGALRSGKGACRGGIRCEIRQTPGIVERERLARVGDYHQIFRLLNADGLVRTTTLATGVRVEFRKRDKPVYSAFAPIWSVTLNRLLVERYVDVDIRRQVFRAFAALPEVPHAAALSVLELGTLKQFLVAVGVRLEAWAA